MLPWDQPTQHLDRSAVFAQLMAEGPYTLQWVAPSPLQKLPLPIGESRPPSNTWFFGCIWVHNADGISISSVVFAGLTIMTDRPHYSVCNNRLHRIWLVGWLGFNGIYLCSTVVLRCSLIIIMMIIITRGQSNWSKRPHYCIHGQFNRIRPVIPNDTNLHPHLTYASMGSPESTTQMASQSVQPFLQGSESWQTDRPTDRQTMLLGL